MIMVKGSQRTQRNDYKTIPALKHPQVFNANVWYL
jgi:hypothetical protein